MVVQVESRAAGETYGRESGGGWMTQKQRYHTQLSNACQRTGPWRREGRVNLNSILPRFHPLMNRYPQSTPSQSQTYGTCS